MVVADANPLLYHIGLEHAVSAIYRPELHTGDDRRAARFMLYDMAGFVENDFRTPRTMGKKGELVAKCARRDKKSCFLAARLAA